MKFNKKSAEKFLHKLEHAAKSRSPEIKLITGLAGVVVATVLYCKGAVKAEAVKEDFSKHRETLAVMKEAVEKGEIITRNEEQLEEKVIDMTDIRKEMGLTYRKAAIGLLRCYLMPTVTMAGSIALIILSHGELRGQNAALYAALSSRMVAYDRLRKRIKDKYGPEIENELVNGITTKEITNTTINENGKKVETKEIINEWDGNLDDYSVEFSETTNINYDVNPEYNRMFINGILKTEESSIHIQRSKCLNEALVALGFDPKKYRRPEGYAIGWYVNPENEDEPCIDYVIHEVTDTRISDENGQPRRTAFIIEFKNLKPLYGNDFINSKMSCKNNVASLPV